MANAFFVRCDCRNRRFTGGKSRFLQEADGRKGIASAADELCGSALSPTASRPSGFCIIMKKGSSRKVRETNREEPNEHKEETVISVAISKALGNFNLVIESLKFTC